MKLKILGVLVCLLVQGACTLPTKQIYVVSDTSLGVHGSINTAQTAGQLVIGYDRKFAAVVPKLDVGGDSEAMSAFNCTHVKIEGMTLTEFRERLATGDAASKLADSLSRASTTIGCQLP